ncbi:MAG: SRPBCC domain-containing protein [Actinomycetota bacterium]|jgi:carbon monoxide dehydrogenase subunit G|nr:SRPBCC domain-containing protein [Actinomycetota bacterium]
MAEQLVNEFTVNRPIDEAWPVITDVERIAPCLPGAQLQEVEGEIYRGIVKIKLGSITPKFSGQAEFVERDDEKHHAVLKADGRDTGGRGNASANITADAESLSPTSTRVVVSTELHITGKVAQFGRGIIGDVSKKLMAQFANNLNTMLDEQQVGGDASGDQAGATEPLPAPEPDEASTMNPTSAAPAVDTTSAPSNGQPSGATTTSGAGAGPTVRRVDSPASEPVDLAGVAGPAVLKRLAPVVLALVAAVFFLRRRGR